MFSFLRQPYPPPTLSYARQLLVALLVGAFVAVFLIVFQPFGTADSQIEGLNWFLSGYGLVIAASILLPFVLLRLLRPRLLLEDNWTIATQLIYAFVILFGGITASYFYLLTQGGEANWRDYRYFTGNALFVASMPIIVITLLDYIRKLRYYETGAAGVRLDGGRGIVSAGGVPPAETGLTLSLRGDEPTDDNPATVTLYDSKNRPALETAAGDIWCLHSDGNYVEIYVRERGIDTNTYTRHLIRNTIAQLSRQLPDGVFLTCHRSWIVNPDLVEDVTGNAQGYRLHRTGAPGVIVARGRSKTVLERLK